MLVCAFVGSRSVYELEGVQKEGKSRCILPSFVWFITAGEVGVARVQGAEQKEKSVLQGASESLL